MERVRDNPVLDVSGLPTVIFRERNPIFWGNVIYMTIEGAMFAMVFASYFYLRSRSTDWPPGVHPPYLWYGAANTILLIISVVPARWIQFRARAGDLPSTRLGLIILGVIGVAALALRGLEFSALNCRWDTNAYGSMIWAMLILHTGHLITEWVETLVMIAFASSSNMEGKRFPDFDVNSDYWFFVVGWALVMNFVIYGTTRFL
jgi:heme/copper-type cytochrome/quinol oxidase subunit 3